MTIDPVELERLSKAATAPGALIADKGAFLVALETAYRTGQLVPAQPSGDVVEAVARGMAPKVFLPFDPKLHGSPVNHRFAQKMWLENATAAITALRGKP